MNDIALDEAPDLQRRFGGVARLYGAAGLERFQSAHVCVIGIGGVGSWAAEALARNAIGHITLIDLDNIAESNVNRQLHAVDGAFGKAKVTAMAERIRSINPHCQVHEVEDFVTAENVAQVLGISASSPDSGRLGSNATSASLTGLTRFDAVLDAIDDARAKVAIAAYCKRHKLPLVMTGAAGGRLDPTRIRSADLALTTGDRLLAKVRNQLRRDHGFAKGEKAKFDIQAVFSDEQVQKPAASCDASADASAALFDSVADTNAALLNGVADANATLLNASADASASLITTSVGANASLFNSSAGASTSLSGLNCAGYGSSVCVTAPFGMAAAALVLNLLIKKTAA